MQLVFRSLPLAAALLALGPAAALAGDELTPPALARVTLVDARAVADLRARGDVGVVDTRALHDFLAGHIPDASHVDYRERSARIPGFDAGQDDTAAFLQRLRKFVRPDRAVVFYCNGPTCWKSYKAAAVARDAGYGSVYWFRGGMTEWQRGGNPVVAE